MFHYELFEEFSSDVFHEFADVDENLEDELIAYLGALSVQERAQLAKTLLNLSKMSPGERSSVLEMVHFSWEVDDEVGFFVALSEVAQGIED
jgi:hypothetical protein